MRAVGVSRAQVGSVRTEEESRNALWAPLYKVSRAGWMDVTVVVGNGGGVRRGTHFMRSRSVKTIDPSIPTMPERSTSGFYRPGGRCVPQASKQARIGGGGGVTYLVLV